jgi:thiamine biosynthesis protein ThiS
VKAPETKEIEMVVNGEPRPVPDGLNLADLLEHLGIDPSRVAVELNRAIVRKTDWPATRIGEGARLEIVWFVGGG